MKVGKLPNNLLQEIVISNIKNKREEVITRAGIGEDCAVVDFGEYSCVLSTDPITGASEHIGRLAIHISCNDVASNGAEPIGVLLTILAPKGTREKEIAHVMTEAGQAAKEINVEIMGGHTEITDAVNKMILSTTVIGKQLKSKTIQSKKTKVGDVVLLTKTAGIEGTSIIAHELEEKLKKYISSDLIDQGKEMGKNLSVVQEGLIASQFDITYMHDVTEGGILGAIWEGAFAIGKGIQVNKEAIPLASSTKAICEALEIEPLKLIASGSMLIICNKEDVDALIKELERNHIPTARIGEVIEKGILLIDNGVEEKIDEPDSDELYKVI